MSDNAKKNGSVGNVVIWVAAAFACTYAANHKCDFVKIYDSRTPDVFMARGIWKGMWTVGSACTTYRDGGFYIDRYWNASRYASVIADILAGFALIMSCALSAPQAQNKAGVGAIASWTTKACLFQGLTLLFLTCSACTSKTGIPANYTKCEISQAGNLSIAATVLWFMASLSSCCTGAVVLAQAQMEQMEKEGEGAKEEGEVGVEAAA